MALTNLLEKAVFAENADDNSQLLKRLSAALVQAAVDVRAEEEPSPMTDKFVARQHWASAVLAGPALWARTMLPGLLTNATIAASLGAGATPPTDNELQFTVNSLIDTYSSYTPEVS